MKIFDGIMFRKKNESASRTMRGIVVSIDPFIVIPGSGNEVVESPIYIEHITDKRDYPNNHTLILKYANHIDGDMLIVLWDALGEYRCYNVTTGKIMLLCPHDVVNVRQAINEFHCPLVAEI